MRIGFFTGAGAGIPPARRGRLYYRFAYAQGDFAARRTFFPGVGPLRGGPGRQGMRGGFGIEAGSGSMGPRDRWGRGRARDRARPPLMRMPGFPPPHRRVPPGTIRVRDRRRHPQCAAVSRPGRNRIPKTIPFRPRPDRGCRRARTAGVAESGGHRKSPSSQRRRDRAGGGTGARRGEQAATAPIIPPSPPGPRVRTPACAARC